VLATLLRPVPEEGGEIKYVRAATNIRAARSTEAKIVGKLSAGQKVKVDFLDQGWYAVFEVDQPADSEADALGYVYAPLLKDVPASK